jgi:hypothetical protein
VPSSQPDSDDDALLNAALSGDGEEVLRLLLRLEPSKGRSDAQPSAPSRASSHENTVNAPPPKQPAAAPEPPMQPPPARTSLLQTAGGKKIVITEEMRRKSSSLLESTNNTNAAGKAERQAPPDPPPQAQYYELHISILYLVCRLRLGRRGVLQRRRIPQQ